MTNKNNSIKTTLLRWWHFFIYKSNSKDVYWGKIIPSMVVLFGFAIFIFFNNKRVDKLTDERNQFERYTIGITTAGHNNIKGSLVIDYRFRFLNSEYSNSNATKSWLIDKPIVQGGRYYVQFAYNNPTNAEILFKYPVPDSIINAPDRGWVYMPGYEDKK
jgi:hypothetical protein